MATKKTTQAITMDVLKDTSRVVNFIGPVEETWSKLEMVKQDAKFDKTAKAYAEIVEQQYRNQLKFLYEAAREAFPEDKVNPAHAHSSLGPSSILEKYDFQVIVSRKT